MAFSFDLEVMAHDIDINCNATPSAVIRYLQETVDRNLRTCHPSYQELLGMGLSFIVSRTALKMYRPLKEYETIKVTTWATETKGATFPRNYRMTSGDETVAECVMTWALIDIKDGRLLKGSEFDISGYGTGELLELDIPTRLRIPKDIELTKCGSERVMYRDIDRNRHMNNTKYFDLLFSYIPNRENVYITSCLMNYASEAKWENDINIYISAPEECENGETAYYFRTEVDGRTNVEAKFTVRVI